MDKNAAKKRFVQQLDSVCILPKNSRILPSEKKTKIKLKIDRTKFSVDQIIGDINATGLMLISHSDRICSQQQINVGFLIDN